MSTPVPEPGCLYEHPNIPVEFKSDSAVSKAAPDSSTLSTCYAVTTGPDRNLYWVYKHMPATATSIPAPVEPGCCFETIESMGRSQGKARPRQVCKTCGFYLGKHMNDAQARSAFENHANKFPRTHTNLTIPPSPGVVPSPGYAQSRSITAPIPAPLIIPPSSESPLELEPSTHTRHAFSAPHTPVSFRNNDNHSDHHSDPHSQMDELLQPLMLSIPHVTRHAGSTPPTPGQYKILADMVKLNSQLMWSDDQEAHRFLTGLESILEFSPLLPSHWVSLIIMMIPGKYELERLWIRDNIIHPSLSWEAAKATFTKHFQRGDYMDGRRLLYSQCAQMPKETIQEYTRRFQTLMTQLHYSDSDVQTIYHYIEGLHRNIQHKLNQYKVSMRTIGGSASWDFSSLTATATLAITVGTEPIYTQRQVTACGLPLHLQQSALANPMVDTTPKESRREAPRVTTLPINPTQSNKRRSQRDTDKASKHCDYHPNSKSHNTDECHTQGKIGTLTTTTTQPVVPTPLRPVPPVSVSTTATTVKLEPKPSSVQNNTFDKFRSNIQCFRCSQPGHVARNCPQAEGILNKPGSFIPSKPTVNSDINKATTTPPPKRVRRAKVSFNLQPTIFETTLPADRDTPTQE